MTQFFQHIKHCFVNHCGYSLLVLMSCVLITSPVHSESQEIDSLRTKFNQLLYKSRYDSAQTLALDFLKRENLTDIELFHGHYMYAEAIRSSGRPKEAIGAFKLALQIAGMLPDSNLYQSRIHMSIAGCYFDLPDYKMAREYSIKSIELSPDSSLASIGHATNYLILGYCDFVDKAYNSAEEYFLKARVEYVKYDQYCELPLFYAKMAPLYNAKGAVDVAMTYIDSSRIKSRDCGIDLYRIITETTLYNIYRTNGNYKAAIEKSEEIAQLNEAMRFEEQQMQMQTVEKEFEKKLHQAEIDNLREINEKNEIILAKQRQNLWIAISALVLMAVLVILLLMVNQRRRKILTEHEELNSQLEAKVDSRTAHLEEAYERIQAHSETLDRQNKQLTDFYHMITHNLRAPLGNLTGLVKLVDETDDPAKQREMVAHMAPVVENLNFTVNELLEAIQYSRLNTDELKSIAFKDALENASKSLQSEIDRVDATIESDFSEAPEVLYPDNYLTSLFHNLLSNSLKYRSPDRPLKVQVTSQKQGDTIILKFKDNGIGINMKKYGHKLFKAGQVFSDHPDAKGFGLYMTKMQIENNGGKIHIESAPGEGTTVVVEFHDQ